MKFATDDIGPTLLLSDPLDYDSAQSMVFNLQTKSLAKSLNDSGDVSKDETRATAISLDCAAVADGTLKQLVF